jgi:uncharacterized repeat protein (TIGR03803 family)
MKSQIIRRQIPLLAILVVLTVAATQAAQAQTFKVLYDFTGGVDGLQATGGLTWDTQGNLYGVTAFGGTSDYGTAFELSKQGSSSVSRALSKRIAVQYYSVRRACMGSMEAARKAGI